jgi:succinyl-diaminopimelate desuccinylase
MKYGGSGRGEEENVPFAVDAALSAEVGRYAEDDSASVVSLIEQLVRTPSRGGLDSYAPVLDLVRRWLENRGLAARLLRDTATGTTVGVVCDVPGTNPGPRYVLDACIDTAPFGELSAWRYPPTAAVIEDGWLFGRGAADSKAAVAIFVHIASRLQHQADRLHGKLTLLFDADEHTGAFGGAKNYFGDAGVAKDVAGVMIGYPGTDKLVIGGRGFLRARITVLGRAGHTGSERTDSHANAAEKAATLVNMLAERRNPDVVDPTIGLPPKLTVTAIHGGESYSIIPDSCTVDVDVRLTTRFNEAMARTLIEEAIAQLDERHPTGKPTASGFLESWPAYCLDDTAPIRVALSRAMHRHLPNPPPARVAGPSNIGNYLASLGIDATAGLGVAYHGLHGTDERIDLSTIPMIQATYHEAVLALLSS